MSKPIPTTTIALFEDQQIRRERHQEEWRFSVVDIVSILTGSGSKDRGSYRRKLKQRLGEEGSEVVTDCHELKFEASDGKKYKGDAANTQTLLRIIQSIPSPQAEPIKQRLASLGNERAQELNDPELGMQRSRDRAIEVYKSRGMSDDEITRRLQSIDVRHNYTDELKSRGISSGLEYALLTNISYSRSGHDTKGYRDIKGLVKGDNLRDHMSTTEILLTSLSEEAGKKIAQSRDAHGFEQLQDALSSGSNIAKNAREQIEQQTGSSILEPTNRLTPKQQVLRDKAKKGGSTTKSLSND